MTAVLDGRRVLGSPRDIQEVRNAILAYERLGSWDPSSGEHLREAHGVMMAGLVDRPGMFRPGNVGIQRGTDVIYAALQRADDQADATPFIEFMLGALLEACRDGALSDQVTDQVSDQVKAVLNTLRDGERTALEIMRGVGLSHRPTFRRNYLSPALAAGLAEMTDPASPRSPMQRYRLTRRGRTRLEDSAPA